MPMKSVPKNVAALSPELVRIIEARHHDPFMVLGRHGSGRQTSVHVFAPGAENVSLDDIGEPLSRIDKAGLFRWDGDGDRLPKIYQLQVDYSSGHSETFVDPYCLEPCLSDDDLHLFGEGKHRHAHHFLGAHKHRKGAVEGVLFATWAPDAGRVSVVGDFNSWDGRRHPLRNRGSGGVWELFVPGIAANTLYKFEIRNRDSGKLYVKSDPYAARYEKRPHTASIVTADSAWQWQDSAWMQLRMENDWLHTPMSIYEVHLGSWRRDDGQYFLDYRELARLLVDYLLPLGFTHIELLPITEHPLDASWGYQTTGYFAPTSRHGTPDDFRYFVDYCHRHGIGVLLDWVPGHFPKDAHGLARFDGSAVYEHEDPRKGEHRDWGTLIFNYGRNEVRSFLISSALCWLEEFHIDGLRVDAVASMLYLDYSREDGDWLPNEHGGRENLQAIAFLRDLNEVTHERNPGTMIIAEESTAWPQVSRPVWLGGLGFSAKWNMGWMHDTLAYMSQDPVHRSYHHDLLTFGMLYAFAENFVLPFSHDEVVHGKGTLISRMPGDNWQQFANLRLLFTYMFTWPGKKLLFMGSEFGQWTEWDHEFELDWPLLGWPNHKGIHSLIADLNRLYREMPALHRLDFEAEGFRWIDCHDAAQSVLAYVRTDGEQHIAVILNFTPVPRHGYRIGLPCAGYWEEILNSDGETYAGSNLGNAGGVATEDLPWMDYEQSAVVTLPPLAGVILEFKPG